MFSSESKCGSPVSETHFWPGPSALKSRFNTFSHTPRPCPESVVYPADLEYGIKFRLNKPGRPHLNGKVERSQKTDVEEFYPTVDLKAAGLENLLSEWHHYYNWFRPHSSLVGKSPDERRLELSSVTPFWDEVWKNCRPERERLRVQTYYYDLRLAKLK